MQYFIGPNGLTTEGKGRLRRNPLSGQTKEEVEGSEDVSSKFCDRNIAH